MRAVGPSRRLERALGAHAARAGVSLIEVAIVITLLGVFAQSAWMALDTGTRVLETGSERSALQARASKAMGQVTRALTLAGIDSMTGVPAAPFFDDRISFESLDAVDTNTGTLSWTAHEIRLESEPGEKDDGLDNDGDGLIDEGRIVHVIAPGTAEEREVTIASGIAELYPGESWNGKDDNGNGLIDEHGLAFALDGERLRILLSLEVVDGEEREVARSLETTLRIRN